ncbi:hypothetical protein PORY_002479 [Pneumocystis oryctolagi]|uniref:Uncharacterized protein n=1 Tax=Pneumocystis oryctolagi TaxID=42067 RepID=A0ACB7C9J4_9ASCO|nr:hypothetical protein PORY_002479 [Pneumocystis oryctolagi]
MTKTRKKREKIADFHKPKLKVGKPKQKPRQLTSTLFKAKTVVIPKQSILRENLDENSAKKAALMHTLALTKHASGAQRKGALNMLQSQLYASPFKSTMLASIIRTIIPLITDEVPSVRAALRSLLLSVFSEKDVSIQPHILFIVLYIHSAMTHILPGIREDSTKILLWLLDIQGEYVVKYAWDKFLDTFSVLFGWKNDYKASDSKKIVFKFTFFQESRFYHFKAFDIFLKKGLYSDNQKNTGIKAPVIHLHQTKYLSGINHPMVLKYLGKPLKSSPYFHLSLFSQTNNISKKVYDDIQSRSELFCSYLPGLLYCLQATWFELLSSSIELPSPITFETCIIIISILSLINYVLENVEINDAFLDENLKTMRNFILKIEFTIQELKDSNESLELRKYWIESGLFKE